MFAFQQRVRTETSRPEAREAAVVPRPNPVWPSLALRPSPRQENSTAGAAAEAHEREADRVAERVLQTPDPGCGHGDRASSSGDAMDPATRGFMERRLGHDFGQVHIHADDRAAEATRALSARAFAAGEHIYFARDSYAPASSPGQRLLAHELAHVVQQRRLGQPLVQTQAAPGAQPLVPAQPAAGSLGLGSIGQAKSEVIAALDRTVERVQHAIHERDRGGAMPPDVDAALCRFFPSFGADFLDDVLFRIQTMSFLVPGIDAHQVARPALAGTKDAALINMVDPQVPAQTMVRRVLKNMEPGDDYVALFPLWDADASLQATRLLHEVFHFAFDGMFHGGVGGFDNAFAWQGFVSSVGGLATGALLQGFPPCP